MDHRSERRWAPLAIDALCVVVFVVIGRRQHEEGSAVGGIVKTAAPFLLALLGAWVAAKPLGFTSREWKFGVFVWFITVLIGMQLRRFVFDRSTAAAFVIVATVFLALTLIGWRLVHRTLAARRATT
jgi:energy-coupling factor transporter transmembrane protein EcfT